MTENFLLINHLLLINKCYLYKATDSQIKTIEEGTSEETKFLKKWRIINNALSK